MEGLLVSSTITRTNNHVVAFPTLLLARQDRYRRRFPYVTRGTPDVAREGHVLARKQTRRAVRSYGVRDNFAAVATRK